jgi:hypothetical protein
MIVKAEGSSGRAKINSGGPKHALGLVQYLRGIGYKAWIEDSDGNEIVETILKKGDRHQALVDHATDVRFQR